MLMSSTEVLVKMSKDELVETRPDELAPVKD